MGDTSSDVYNDLQNKLEEINLLLDPSSWTEVKISDLLDTSGMTEKVKKAVQNGGEAAEKTVDTYATQLANKINGDGSLKKSFAEALDVDVNDLNVETLADNIRIIFQRMFNQISQDGQQALSELGASF